MEAGQSVRPHHVALRPTTGMAVQLQALSSSTSIRFLSRALMPLLQTAEQQGRSGRTAFSLYDFMYVNRNIAGSSTHSTMRTE